MDITKRALLAALFALAVAFGTVGAATYHDMGQPTDSQATYHDMAPPVQP